MHNASIAFVAAAFASCLGDPTWAAPSNRLPSPSTCKNWDCEGGIICSCCFAGKGCWICDYNPNLPGGVAVYACNWDPKYSRGLVVQPTQPSSGFTPANPATRAPAKRR